MGFDFDFDPDKFDFPDGWKKVGDGDWEGPNGRRYDPDQLQKLYNEGGLIPKEKLNAADDDPDKANPDEKQSLKDSKARAQDEMKNKLKDDEKSKFSDSITGFLRSYLTMVLIFGLFVAGVYEWLAYNNTQTEGQCDCNYSRPAAECVKIPKPSYTPGCQDCDKGTPSSRKMCCRTCKDVLNTSIFGIDIFNLSFLGTNDIIDISQECGTKTEDQCCNDHSTRSDRSSDEVQKCLVSGIEKILQWVFVVVLIIIALCISPWVFKFFKFIYYLFANKDKSQLGGVVTGNVVWVIIPFILMGIICGITLYCRNQADKMTTNSLVNLSTVNFIATIILLISLFPTLICGFSSSNEDTDQYDVAPVIMEQSGGGESSQRSVLLGILKGVCLCVLIVVVLSVLYCYFFGDTQEKPCTPPTESITKMNNVLFDVYYNNMEGCLKDNNESWYAKLFDCFNLKTFHLEGLDNSPASTPTPPATPNCTMINTDYINTNDGEKRYYCFSQNCGYDGNKCINKPNCGLQDDDQSLADKIKVYSGVAATMVGDLVKFNIKVKLAKTVGFTAMKEIAFSVGGEEIGGFVAAQFIPGVDVAVDILFAAQMIGQILDAWDPCKYQSFISNTDIKNKYRDFIDISSISELSSPNFFPLSLLQVVEKETSSEALIFQILYRGYTAWTSFITMGINDIILNGEDVITTLMTEAYKETTGNDYCTFKKKFQKQCESTFTKLTELYYNNKDIVDQINNDTPSDLKGESSDIFELQQIQLWKYIYRYCKNGGMYTTMDSNGNSQLVLYDGTPTDGITNIPDLWDNGAAGVEPIKNYIITIEQLGSLKNLVKNGPAMLNGDGGRKLQTLLKSMNTWGIPCGDTAADPNNICILDNIIVTVSNKYRNYGGCSNPETPCNITYTTLPHEFSLYYPSSSVVNTLCKYSMRGLKWILQRHEQYLPSENTIMGVLDGVNEKIDNSKPSSLGSEYYDENNGLCNFNLNYCHQKACRHTYCYPAKVNEDITECTTAPGSQESYMDCDNSNWQKPWEWLGSTAECGAEHLFTDGSISCPTE